MKQAYLHSLTLSLNSPIPFVCPSSPHREVQLPGHQYCGSKQRERRRRDLHRLYHERRSCGCRWTHRAWGHAVAGVCVCVERSMHTEDESCFSVHKYAEFWVCRPQPLRKLCSGFNGNNNLGSNCFMCCTSSVVVVTGISGQM